jgi:hypothetical protein
MKKAILFIVALIATIYLNQFYFEYCVSRPCNELLTIVLGVVLVVIDLGMLILAVKTLKHALKL